MKCKVVRGRDLKVGDVVQRFWINEDTLESDKSVGPWIVSQINDDYIWFTVEGKRICYMFPSEFAEVAIPDPTFANPTLAKAFQEYLKEHGL